MIFTSTRAQKLDKCTWLAIVTVAVVAGCSVKPGGDFSMTAKIPCVFVLDDEEYFRLSPADMAYVASGAIWEFPEGLEVESAHIETATHEATWGSRGDPGGAFRAKGFRLDIHVSGKVALDSLPGKKTVSVRLPRLHEKAGSVNATALCYLWNAEWKGWDHQLSDRWHGPDAVVGSLTVSD